MPRQMRTEWEGAIHHAVPQGNNRQRIVVDDHDRRALVSRLGKVAAARRWDVFAYAIMNTHVHYVVRTPDADLGPGTGRLLGGYARRFNLRHGHDGALFRPRFYSRPITDERHFLAACLYTVLNPVAAGLCRDPADYAWSSFRSTVRPDHDNGPIALTEWVTSTFAEPLPDALETYRELAAACAERVWRRKLEARRMIREMVEGAVST